MNFYHAYISMTYFPIFEQIQASEDTRKYLTNLMEDIAQKKSTGWTNTLMRRVVDYVPEIISQNEPLSHELSDVIRSLEAKVKDEEVLNQMPVQELEKVM